MKISDSLGNLYTHTMFKKKSYEMKDDADEITVAVPSKNRQQKHYSDEEDEDDNDSVTSDRSEDSISEHQHQHHHMSRASGRQNSERRSTPAVRAGRSVSETKCSISHGIENCSFFTLEIQFVSYVLRLLGHIMQHQPGAKTGLFETVYLRGNE